MKREVMHGCYMILVFIIENFICSMCLRFDQHSLNLFLILFAKFVNLVDQYLRPIGNHLSDSIIPRISLLDRFDELTEIFEMDHFVILVLDDGVYDLLDFFRVYIARGISFFWRGEGIAELIECFVIDAIIVYAFSF